MMESCDESGMVHHLEHKYDRNRNVKVESQSKNFER